MNSNVLRSMVVISGLTTTVEFSAILASRGSSQPLKHSPVKTRKADTIDWVIKPHYVIHKCCVIGSESEGVSNVIFWGFDRCEK